MRVAANIRALTERSTLLWGEFKVQSSKFNSDLEQPEPLNLERGTTKVRDAYSLRCIPQVHGAARDTVGYVRSLLLTELNSANDNPAHSPDEFVKFKVQSSRKRLNNLEL